MNDAGPGDVIVMADGIYEPPVERRGDHKSVAQFVLNVSGTSEKPLVVCGSEGAVVLGEPDSPFALTVKEDVQHIGLYGFTVVSQHSAIQASETPENVIEVQVKEDVPADDPAYQTGSQTESSPRSSDPEGADKSDNNGNNDDGDSSDHTHHRSVDN
jgi:hypothetical protein